MCLFIPRVPLRFSNAAKKVCGSLAFIGAQEMALELIQLIGA